jgi:hypothetical protein
MRHRLIQIAGIAWTLIFSAFIIWIYATAPRTLHEVATNTQVTAGTYQVDRARFDAALDLFHRGEFRAAREELARADPAQADPRTQFYIAYSFYREGWGRVYNDDALFRQGLEAVNRVQQLTQGGSALSVDDPDLKMHTAAELKAELEAGTERSVGDLNPLKVFRERK